MDTGCMEHDGQKDNDKSEFPLHKFDYVSLKEIYQNLSLVDIFELSFTSRKIRSTLRSASVEVLSILIDFNAQYPSIEMRGADSSIRWTFGFPDELKYEDIGVYQFRRFQYNCKKSAEGYHTDHYDMEHGMLAVLRHMISIYNCSKATIAELSLNLAVIEDSRVVFEHFTKFKSVDRLAILQSVDIERNKLNFMQNFDWVMSNLNVKEMYVGVEIMEPKTIRKENGEFQIRTVAARLEKMLHIDHICLQHSEWVTSQDILNLDVKTAILMESRLTERDLNTFIKQWLASTSNKLCWLEVRSTKFTFDKDAILEGLALEEDSYRQQHAKCSCPYRRFESASPVEFVFPTDSKQVVRPNSSTTASISITFGAFFFHVKNEGPITPAAVQEGVLGPNDRNMEERLRLLGVDIEDMNFLRHPPRPEDEDDILMQHRGGYYMRQLRRARRLLVALQRADADNGEGGQFLID